MKFDEFSGQLSILNTTMKVEFSEGRLTIWSDGLRAARVLELLDLADEVLGSEDAYQGEPHPPPIEKPTGASQTPDLEPETIVESPEEPATEPLVDPTALPLVGAHFEEQEIVETLKDENKNEFTMTLANGVAVIVDLKTGEEKSRQAAPAPEPAKKKRKSSKNSAGVRERVLRFLSDHPDVGMTAASLSKALEVDDVQDVRNALSRLNNDDKIDRVSRGVYRFVRAAVPEGTLPGEAENGPDPGAIEDVEPSNGAAASPDGELPEEVRKSPDLFPVITYMRNQGVVDEDEIVARCVSSRQDIACLRNVADVEDRVRRVVSAFGA